MMPETILLVGCGGIGQAIKVAAEKTLSIEWARQFPQAAQYCLDVLEKLSVDESGQLFDWRGDRIER